MTWRETPKSLRFIARKLDGTEVDFKDLRRGDIFRAIAPEGYYIDPVEGEEVDEDFVCLATADPIKNDHLNDCNGYLLEMITGPFKEVAPRGMN